MSDECATQDDVTTVQRSTARLEIHAVQTAVSMSAKSKRLSDPLYAVEFGEQSSACSHENEAKNQSTEREPGCDGGNAARSSIDLGVGRLSRNWHSIRDIEPIVLLRGDRRTVLLVTLDFYRRTQA